jgi:GGDEF domain-containing protein
VEATKLRSSCGFLLAAIDNLGSINRSYGFDIADEVITVVAKRIHSRLRPRIISAVTRATSSG